MTLAKLLIRYQNKVNIINAVSIIIIDIQLDLLEAGDVQDYL